VAEEQVEAVVAVVGELVGQPAEDRDLPAVGGLGLGEAAQLALDGADIILGL
jgi:hypothetical protein